MRKLTSCILLLLALVSNMAWAGTETGPSSIQNAIDNALRTGDLENKAKKARESRNYERAIKYYKEAIALSPYDFSSRLALGDTYKERGMLDEAIAEYKEILEIRPNSRYALLTLGSIHYEKNLLLEATNYFYKAGLICAELGDEGMLAKAYEGLTLSGQTSKIESLKIKAWYYKGKKAFDAKNYDEAITYFEKNIQLGGNYVKVHIFLALAYLEKGLSDLSADHSYKAGILFLNLGDRENAVQAYQVLKLANSPKLEQALFEKLYPELKQKKSEPS